MELASNTNPFLKFFNGNFDDIELPMLNYEKEEEMEELGIQGHTTVLLDMSKYEINKLYNNYLHRTKKLNTLVVQIIPQQLKLVEQFITFMPNNLSSEAGQINYTIENLF